MAHATVDQSQRAFEMSLGGLIRETRHPLGRIAVSYRLPCGGKGTVAI